MNAEQLLQTLLKFKQSGIDLSIVQIEANKIIPSNATITYDSINKKEKLVLS